AVTDRLPPGPRRPRPCAPLRTGPAPGTTLSTRRAGGCASGCARDCPAGPRRSSTPTPRWPPTRASPSRSSSPSGRPAPSRARAAAAIRHPHVVPVYDVGEYQGRLGYTMALAAGGSLAQRRGAYRHDPLAAAALVEKIARGVAAAHAAGIVHRDLKPGNVLFD